MAAAPTNPSSVKDYYKVHFLRPNPQNLAGAPPPGYIGNTRRALAALEEYAEQHNFFLPLNPLIVATLPQLLAMDNICKAFPTISDDMMAQLMTHFDDYYTSPDFIERVKALKILIPGNRAFQCNKISSTTTGN